ncbi:MAG: hypothetical protein ACYDCK_08975 [Thermoplasmatota archaeon]
MQGVRYTDLTNVNTALYFVDNNAPPGPGSGTPPGVNQGGISHGMTTQPPKPSSQGGAGDVPSRDVYGLANPGVPVGPTQTAEFASMALKFPINVTGDNAIAVTWSGEWPNTDSAGNKMSWTVTVKAEGTTIGSTSFVDNPAGTLGGGCNAGTNGNSGDKFYTCPVKLARNWGGTFNVHAAQRFLVDINATFTASSTLPVGLPVSPTTWTLDVFDSQNPTFLEVRAADAIKAAAWTMDIHGHAKTLFRPNKNPDFFIENRIWGYLAVRDAFGLADITNTTSSGTLLRDFQPKLHYLRNGTDEFPVPPTNLTTLDLESDASNTSSDDGRAVYRVQLNELWNFYNQNSKSPPGEYVLRSSGTMRPDDANRQAASIAVDWHFVISSESIEIVPFDDPTTTGQQHPLESQSHEVAAGATTTFLVQVLNHGDANDTMTLVPTLVSSQPTFGWSARLGGPDLTNGDQTRVGPQNSTLVTVTVSAPAAATNGQSAIFSLVATSGLDPTVKSTGFTLISTVSANVVPAAGVIIRNPNAFVRPGVDNIFQVYAWNRGTRTANVTIHLNESPLQHWNTSIFQGSVEGRAATVSSVPAGDIAPLTLKVDVDVGTTSGSQHNLTLFATQLPAFGATMQHDMVFTVKPTSTFEVKILNALSGDTRHRLEMECDSAQPLVGCNPGANPVPTDGLNGTFYRIWVTNTGDQTDTYDFTIPGDHIHESTPTGVDVRSAAWPATPGTNDFQLGYRTPKGGFSPNSVIHDVRPGQTGEIYVWVHHQRDSGKFFTDDFSFVVDVKSEATNLHQAVEALATGKDNLNGGSPHKSGVLLEPVERRPDYFASDIHPLVDLRYVDQPVVIKPVDLSGTPQYFFARVTDAADWFTYDDSNGHFSSDINLTLQISDPTHAWNVTMRPRTGEQDLKKNPWLHNVTFHNTLPTATTASGPVNFVDEELEIRVVPPPSNSTHHVLAGDKLAFTLNAKQSEGEGATGSGTASLAFEALVASLANVSIYSSEKNEPVHAGQATAFSVTIANNASASTLAHFTAKVDQATTDPNLWGVSPTVSDLSLAAYENRTLALIVNAPSSASPGQQAVINATIQYRRDPTDPNSELVNRTLDLVAEVKAPGKLKLTAVPSTQAVAPGGTANFTLALDNLDTKSIAWQSNATRLENWTQSLSPLSGTLAAGATTHLAYVLSAPTTVIRDRSYATVIKVTEPGNPDDFDIVAVTVNIIGGAPRPIVQALLSSATVDRDGLVKFPISISNLGNTQGNFPLEPRVDQPGWIAGVETTAGHNVTSVIVDPNQLVTVNLTVHAPLTVAEGTIASVSLRAVNDPVSPTSESDVTVRALIHDYGVSVQAIPTRADLEPGLGKDFVARVTNLGNDNDSVNLSMDFEGLAGWTADFGTTAVRLFPGQASDVHFSMRTPITPLPTPRDYTTNLLAASLGAANVGLAKNATTPLVVTVLNYRTFDVDGDGFVELAIDVNKRASDGFEQFAEIHSEGVQTRLVDSLSGQADGRTDFLLEVPTNGAYTGVANVYFDPDALFTYKIEFTPDYTGDSTPDYLLDTDNNGLIDHAYDIVTKTLSAVTVIHAFGGTASQYLIDTNNDGRPDKYYDPAKNLVTKTIPAPDKGPNVLGLDTVGDGKPHKYYDIQTGQITNAGITNLADFAKQYWYFFALFVVVVVLAAVVISRRRKA